MFKTIFVILILCFSATYSFAEDTTVVSKTDKWANYEHLPKRAVLWSLFPGFGQIYNEVGYRKVSNKKHRAWWKAPIIWGGLGVSGYFWYDNFSNARLLREEILGRRESGDSTAINPLFSGYVSEFELINGYTDVNGIVQQGFDSRARNRDLLLFATLGIYGLQLIEAFVDGHFVSFDVSEDLTMSWHPVMMDRFTPGFSLTFSFN